MNENMDFRVETPCGFEIWIVPLDNGTVRFGVYRNGKAVSMDALSGEMSIYGMLEMANKMQEIAILWKRENGETR